MQVTALTWKVYDNDNYTSLKDNLLFRGLQT